MTAGPSIGMSGRLHEHLEQASPDLLREMVWSFRAGADERRGRRGHALPVASAATSG
jgi:hypothetical protein